MLAGLSGKIIVLGAGNGLTAPLDRSVVTEALPPGLVRAQFGLGDASCGQG